MASSPTYCTTIPINLYGNLKDLGVWSNRGGKISIGQYLPNFEIFKCLYVGVGGNLDVEGIDGSTISYGALPGGSFVPILGYRVLDTTTADDITWSGGAGSRLAGTN